MSKPVPLIASANRLLSALSPSDMRLLRPALKPERFERRHVFVRPGKPIDEVWFLESGLASTVAGAADGENAEQGTEVVLTGNDGCTGWQVVLDDDQSPHYCHAQAAGRALVVNAVMLRRAAQSSASLRRLLLNYVHVAMVQAAETALANARASLEERLARWLLMARDRQAGDEQSLTHLFLSGILGVRRAGVTIALQDLERRALVGRRRGRIVIADRKGLEALAGSFYGVPEAEYRRLIG